MKHNGILYLTDALHSGVHSIHYNGGLFLRNGEHVFLTAKYPRHGPPDKLNIVAEGDTATKPRLSLKRGNTGWFGRLKHGGKSYAITGEETETVQGAQWPVPTIKLFIH